MKLPFARIVRRKITDSDGKTRVIGIGIEFGLRDEEYSYTVEER